MKNLSIGAQIVVILLWGLASKVLSVLLGANFDTMFQDTILIAIFFSVSGKGKYYE